jgi:hypothetical protein
LKTHTFLETFVSDFFSFLFGSIRMADQNRVPTFPSSAFDDGGRSSQVGLC